MRLPPDELQRLLNATPRPAGGGAARAYTVRVQGRSGFLGVLTVVAGLLIGLVIAIMAAVVGVIASAGALLIRKVAGLFQKPATTSGAEVQANVIDIESSVVASDATKSQDP